MNTILTQSGLKKALLGREKKPSRHGGKFGRIWMRKP